jgi:DNA-directed RNA polymerase I, II, and III subunit RPABC1
MNNAILTIKDMLRQRGYSIDPDYEYPDCDGKDAEDTRIVAIRVNDDGEEEEIVAFMTPVVKLNVGVFKEYISVLHTLEIDRGIIIYTDSITPIAKQLIDGCEVTIETFNINELQYNITQHVLVPKHERMCTDDAVMFKKKYGNKVQSIMKTDPISRFYGYSRGDIIKITRSFKSGPLTIGYRIVKGR